jgi:hypothetical protein
MSQSQKFKWSHTSLLPSAAEQGQGSPVRKHPSGFFFLTPVWGEAYTSLYVETVIPAQLASGNLPAFHGEHNHRYIIYTTPQDAGFIRSSPIFEPLNACVPVTFEFLSRKVNVVHDMMTDCYRRGIKAADDADAAVVFLTPDIVLSDNAFTTIKRLSECGRGVIYIPAIRTTKSTVVARLKNSFRRGDTIQISPRHLMRVALDNLHPLADASWWDEGEYDLLPANIYWRVGDEGIVGRCFHLHPIFVFPQQKNVTFFGTVDDDYVTAACPDQSHDFVVEDSDQLLAIELSDPRRYFVTRLAKGSVVDAARWAEQFANERHRSLFKATVRMHSGILETAKWVATEERARLVAEQIETRLNLPARYLLADADILVRRFIQRMKAFRTKFANRSDASVSKGAPPTWKGLIFSAVDVFVRVRSGVINLMRRLAGQIEGLSARRYQAKVRGDLASVLPAGSEAVLLANNPEKSYIAPLLGELSSSFSAERYVTLLRGQSAIVLEKGEQIRDSSKDVAVLEVDSYRKQDVGPYLHECQRILRDNGRLIVSLHRLGFKGHSDNASISAEQISKRLGGGFHVISITQQGGLGSYVRVKVAAWLRDAVRRWVTARWALVILGVPLLPVIIVLGGIFIMATGALDFFDRSTTFSVSSLILAEKGPSLS